MTAPISELSPGPRPGDKPVRPTTVRPTRNFHRLAWLAVLLAVGVIVFGAFVRLSDAGLSCPDWPTCYGRAAWPTTVDQGDGHAAIAIRPVEVHKAWREQFHRMIAGALGVLTLALALLAARRRHYGVAQVIAASLMVAVAIPLYMRGMHVPAAVLALAGEAVLMFAALRWSNLDLARVAVFTLGVIVFQALLGMWTVTWLLKPLVVMGHLLGGLLTFSLLLWMAWRATDLPIRLADALKLRRWILAGLVLLAMQIALGGWTSANYAALACGTDFPTCVGRWWPPTDFREGFVLWRGIGVDYEGGVLDGASRIAIQMAHRLMAVVLFIYLLWLAVRLSRTPGIRGWATALGVAIIAQASLGIANVKLALPLWTAVLHNAGAVLLLFVLVSLLARLRAPDA
ncbi:COX15/CtaA family protein [Novilysobacter avium]|uniref:COX15/CtaA family protein n=1 Tax=Novilysobacter avium TaxID=2781023 RepID=A0A7S6UKC4_9GAMM|nr:COX15/CtaA family protein [Lysobacter avium]QOW21819.1 COX15/CtaA family protein [Lysobacter avium]